MTQAISVRCQHCGAPLQISDTLRFVTCAYCHTELEIVRDASTIHTEILSKIEASTDAMAGRLEVIEIQNELARLDHDWETWRDRNLDRMKDGSLYEPGPPMHPGTGFRISMAIGVAVVVFAFLFSWPLQGYLLGPVAFAAALWVVKGQNAQAATYEASLIYYQNQRTVLLHRLDAARARP